MWNTEGNLAKEGNTGGVWFGVVLAVLVVLSLFGNQRAVNQERIATLEGYKGVESLFTSAGIPL